MAKASGNNNNEWKSRARSGHSAARPRADTTTMARRAPRLRSISGPSAGATTAKGAMVNSRYSSTLSLAAVGEMEKKSDPASETANMVSPAVMSTWVRASRPNGLRWSNKSANEERTRRRNWSPRSRTLTRAWYVAWLQKSHTLQCQSGNGPRRPHLGDLLRIDPPVSQRLVAVLARVRGWTPDRARRALEAGSRCRLYHPGHLGKRAAVLIVRVIGGLRYREHGRDACVGAVEDGLPLVAVLVRKSVANRSFILGHCDLSF